MSAELVILVATAVLAVVAIGAAVVAVTAARRVADARRELASPGPTDRVVAPAPTAEVVVADRPAALAPRVVEGRVMVPPTEQQVVATALGRPLVRVSVLLHGLAHALRPESRDRIGGMMRREYRRRRRERLRVGRQAARAARPTPPADSWLGELPASPGRRSVES